MLLDVPDSSRDYGVNRLSILDKAPHFDLCKCMPHDIMHVILEGVLPLHCKLLLVHCMFEEHYFSLKTVNRLISEFSYGYSESKNVPRPLDNDHLRSSDGKLSQSGMIAGADPGVGNTGHIPPPKPSSYLPAPVAYILSKECKKCTKYWVI